MIKHDINWQSSYSFVLFKEIGINWCHKSEIAVFFLNFFY